MQIFLWEASNNVKVKYTLLINTFLGIILALTPFILFPVCSQTKPDGAFMGCHYSGVLITIMGVIIALMSIAAIFTRIYVMSFIISVIAAVSCRLIPDRISGVSLCGNPEHACRAVTMPKVDILIFLIVIISVAGLIINFVKSK